MSHAEVEWAWNAPWDMSRVSEAVSCSWGCREAGAGGSALAIPHRRLRGARGLARTLRLRPLFTHRGVLPASRLPRYVVSTMGIAKRRVFLSYGAGDRPAARELAEGLRDKSFDVWTDDLIAPGQNWAAEVARALDRSDAMVVLLTPSSVKSEWVKREVEFALATKRYESRLIPVVLGGEGTRWPDKAPWVLKRMTVVQSPSAAEASEQVAEVLNKSGRTG